MARQDKKQKQAKKKQERARQLRRQTSMGPAKQLAVAKGTIECWSTGSLATNRQVGIYAFKSGQGISGMACFLIDIGVVGLKDAWERVPMTRGEFQGMLEISSRTGPSTPGLMPLEEARALIAGAMRWTAQHGMRLPEELKKGLAIIGGVGEWETADTSRFEKSFEGHPEDLRQRLVGEPLESFMKRDDVRFFFSDAAPYEDHETGRFRNGRDAEGNLIDDDDGVYEAQMEELSGKVPVMLAMVAEAHAPLRARIMANTTAWLAKRGETPGAGLESAWICAMGLPAIMSALSKSVTDDEAEVMESQLRDAHMKSLTPDALEDFDAAMKQVRAYSEAEPDELEVETRKYNVTVLG